MSPIFKSRLSIKWRTYQGKLIIWECWVSIGTLFLSSKLGGARHLHWGRGVTFPPGFTFPSGRSTGRMTELAFWACDFPLRRNVLSGWRLWEKSSLFCSAFLFFSLEASRRQDTHTHSFLSLHAADAQSGGRAPASGLGAGMKESLQFKTEPHWPCLPKSRELGSV